MRNKLECVPAFFFVVSLVPCPYVCAYACTVTFFFFSYLLKHEGALENLHGSWLKCVCVFLHALFVSTVTESKMDQPMRDTPSYYY